MIEINKTYKMFKVLSFSHKDDHNVKYYNCICECGKLRKLNSSSIYAKYPISCGCFKIKRTKETHSKHKKCKTREYRIWNNMKSRCFNKNNHKYYMYGAKGITVCDSWKNSFESFYYDMGQAPSLMHSIDRIDGTKGYFKDNCKWSTPLEQSSNISTNRIIEYKNEKHHVSEWARLLNIPLSTIRHRLRKNLPLNKVFDDK